MILIHENITAHKYAYIYVNSRYSRKKTHKEKEGIILVKEDKTCELRLS